jgi:intein-encoded DNA endonuclease-like protein
MRVEVEFQSDLLQELTPTHSLDRRISAYDKAVHLSRDGHSITEISNETEMPDSTIRGWLVDGRRPWTRYELFKPISSDQLSYAIGVYLGDGSISRWRNRTFLRLRVKDKEFADRFSFTCAQILEKEPYSVRRVEDRDIYETSVANVSFCKFLSQGDTKLDGYLREHPSAFVRGLADSDGCPAVTATRKRGKPWFFVQVVVATSTSIRLLTYAQTILMECLGLKATLVYKGKPRPNLYKNRLIRSRKKVFDLRISRFSDVKQFSQIISFDLARKQMKLDAAIAVRERYGSGQGAVEEWKRRWEQGNREWTLKKSVE